MSASSTMSESKTRLFRSSIDIPQHTRAQVVDLLNLRLADAIDLKMQAKHAHWNAKGKEFFTLHQLFDSIAGRCEEQSDLVAERVTALGSVAKGTAGFVVRNSSVPDYDLAATTGEQHVRALAKSVASFAAQLRCDINLTEELGDKATADVLTEVVRQVDKDLWFLEAHLQA